MGSRCRSRAFLAWYRFGCIEPGSYSLHAARIGCGGPSASPTGMIMEKQSFFQRLKNGLSRTREGWTQRLETLFRSPRLDEDTLASMEEILIAADVGVRATEQLLAVARQHYHATGPADVEFSSRLQAEIVRMLTPPGWDQSDRTRYSARPWVVIFVGVNGVGKTTTIGKFAAQEKQNGKRVLLVAADTFRAAAIEQLETWGARIGVDVVKHQRSEERRVGK